MVKTNFHSSTLKCKNTIMKKMRHASIALLLIGFIACKKSNDSEIALSPSATSVAVGQTLTVALSGNVNASNWSVMPSSAATKTYGLTTSKVNYFTFSQPGVYTVSVSAKSINYDSTRQSLY